MNTISGTTILQVFTVTITVALAVQLTGSTPFPRTALAEEPKVQEAPGKVTEQGTAAAQTRAQEGQGEGTQQGAVAEETRPQEVQAEPSEPGAVTERAVFPTALGPKIVTIQTVNGQYVVAVGGGGGAVNATAAIVGVGTTFTLIDLNGGALRSGDKVQFRTERGTYLVAEGGGGREVKADRTVPREWETFTIREVGSSFSSFLSTIGYNDPFTLQAHNGQYVAAELGGGGNLNASRAVADAWETFRFQGPPVDVTNCPICSTQLRLDNEFWYSEWLEATTPDSRGVLNSLGVVGVDPVWHDRIGRDGFERPVAFGSINLGKNWYPNDHKKQTACGKIDRFGIKVGAPLAKGEEYDWNIHLLPDPPHYASLLMTVKERMQSAGQSMDLMEWFPSKNLNPGYCNKKDQNDRGRPCYYKYTSPKGDIYNLYCGPGGPPCPPGAAYPFLMNAEVTPPKKLRSNPWFWATYTTDLQGNVRRQDHTSLLGKSLCAYGPWVREEGHDWVPEIHPSELLWWREDVSLSHKRYLLVQVQDASKRFRKWSDFADVQSYDGQLWSNKPEYASWWRPWAAPPMIGQFRIAFESDLNVTDAQLPVYTIIERDPKLPLAHFPAQNMYPHTADSSPGSDHAITYTIKNKVGVSLRTVTALTVRERVRYPEKLGIRLQHVCRDAATGRLRGFLSITSAVGRGEDENQGFIILQVDQTTAGGPAAPPTVLARSVEPEAPVLPVAIKKATLVPESLRRVLVDEKPYLVADLEVTTSGGQGQAASLITKAEQVLATQRQPRTLAPATPTSGEAAKPGQSSTIVREVLLDPASRLEVTLQSGDKLSVEVASPLGIAPPLAIQPLPGARPDPAAWKTWAEATGASTTSAAPTQPPLLRAGQWHVELAPSYTPLEDGKPAIDADSPVVEELHATLAKMESARLQQVYGAAQPFTIQWSFSAVNLATNQPVPVKRGETPGAGEIRADVATGPIQNGRLTVTFPEGPGPALYELVATATVTDTLGHTGQATQTFWSHYLGGSTPDKLLDPLVSLVGTLAGLSPHELGALAKQANGKSQVWLAQNARARHAQNLRLAAGEVVKDQVVSFQEFRGLLGAAKQIGKTKAPATKRDGPADPPPQPPS